MKGCTWAALGLAAGIAMAGTGTAAQAESGIASHYNYAGRKSASGEIVRSGAYTAAHRTLPFGTLVKVTNHRNGRSVVVRINDRGPFVRGRVIDVNHAAAQGLGFRGLTRVTLAVQGRAGRAERLASR